MHTHTYISENHYDRLNNVRSSFNTSSTFFGCSFNISITTVTILSVFIYIFIISLRSCFNFLPYTCFLSVLCAPKIVSKINGIVLITIVLMICAGMASSLDF